MDVSGRIKAIVGMVENRPVPVLADIGTDHAYIPMYAVKSGFALYAISCDINNAPLKRAVDNITANGLSHNIRTRLSDGLSGLSPGEAEVVVIAGMGGALIINILTRGAEVAAHCGQIILQPQSEVGRVRRFVHSMSLRISAEEIVFEYGHYYNVLSCQPGKEPPYSHLEYDYGKILLEKGGEVFTQYLAEESEKLRRILRRLDGEDKLTGQSRQSRLKYLERLREIEGVIECR